MSVTIPCTYLRFVMNAGKEKVQKICDLLRKETLEPAQREAEKILLEAKEEAKRMVERGRVEAEEALLAARAMIEMEKEIFHTSMSQAIRQSLEFLRQQIEEKLFNAQLKKVVDAQMRDPAVLAEMIQAMVHAIEKEGTGANLSVAISAAVSKEKVNQLLAKSVVDRLQEKGVVVAAIGGGIRVKLVDENIMLDLSSDTIKELLANYVRNDFRKLIFVSR